jgi:hypothetical protein
MDSQSVQGTGASLMSARSAAQCAEKSRSLGVMGVRTLMYWVYHKSRRWLQKTATLSDPSEDMR